MMANPVRTVGLVVHTGRDDSTKHAVYAASMFLDAGVGVVVVEGLGGVVRGFDPRVSITGPDQFAGAIDIAMSFGGDGTFLRAAHLCRDAGVPVLGVNLGRLGFLAEVEIETLEVALRAVADGRYLVEHRATLDVHVDGATDHAPHSWAINEVSIEKTARHRLLLMDVRLGGELFAKVPADALVVATPTGSTAYALSAGGPIVSPAVDAILIVPVAPHSLFDRTVVAGSNETIDVDLAIDQPPALVSCDGRDPVEVPPGGRISIRGGAKPVAIARLQSLDFFGLVRRKFGLN